MVVNFLFVVVVVVVVVVVAVILFQTRISLPTRFFIRTSKFWPSLSLNCRREGYVQR